MSKALPPLPPIPQSGLSDPGVQKYVQSVISHVNNISPQIQYSDVANSFSQIIANGISHLVLESPITIASGTVTMPSTPVDNQSVTVLSAIEITSLSQLPNTGQTLNGPMTSIAPNASGTWIFRLSNNTWYRIA